MEKDDLKRIDLLLEIIADELYVARTDREFEGAKGSGPEIWENGGRDSMVRDIEKMREMLSEI
jgi:hypothetical protein